MEARESETQFDFRSSGFQLRLAYLQETFGLFTAVLLTIFGAWVALEIVVIAGQQFGILLWALMHLAFLIFVAGVEVGFLRICLALYEGGEPTLPTPSSTWPWVQSS